MKNRFLVLRLNLGYKFQMDIANHLGINPYQNNKCERNERQSSLEVLLKI